MLHVNIPRYEIPNEPPKCQKEQLIKVDTETTSHQAIPSTRYTSSVRSSDYFCTYYRSLVIINYSSTIGDQSLTIIHMYSTLTLILEDLLTRC
jgi:hypothetical protein